MNEYQKFRRKMKILKGKDKLVLLIGKLENRGVDVEGFLKFCHQKLKAEPEWRPSEGDLQFWARPKPRGCTISG